MAACGLLTRHLRSTTTDYYLIMGKNKGKAKPALVIPQASKQTKAEEPAEEKPEIVQTPQERFAEYEAQQLQSFKMVIEGLRADDLMLSSEADFSQKIAEMEKLKQLEVKKIEKQMKIQQLEFSDQIAQCTTEKQLQQLIDKAMK